jgi:hypothetical protein
MFEPLHHVVVLEGPDTRVLYSVNLRRNKLFYCIVDDMEKIYAQNLSWASCIIVIISKQLQLDT